MYLSLFNVEEKNIFFSLAYFIVKIDGDFSVEENELIESYKTEIHEDIDESLLVNDKNEIIKLYSDLDTNKKKMIIFELIGLSMCDHNFDENEKAFVIELLHTFDSNDYFVEQCEKNIMEYLSIQEKINKSILD